MVYENKLNITKSLREMEVGGVDYVPADVVREMSLRNAASLLRRRTGARYIVHRDGDTFIVTRER